MEHHFSSRRTKRRRGYVLVVTLGLLVLSATLLVAVGRVAEQHALAAKVAGDDLQRRWGAASCREAVLPFAEQVLVTAERQENAPVAVLRVTVRLGGGDFHLIVADEQAKANVNALLETLDRTIAENRLREALSGSGLGNSIRLRAATLADPAPTSGPARPQGALRLTGFGQVFDDVPPEKLLGGIGPAPVDRLTCWGNGAVNLMRASQASLELATASSLTKLQVARLLAARDAEYQPSAGHRPLAGIADRNGTQINTKALDPVSRLLAEAQVQIRDRASLGLVSRSQCHSLWIVIDDSRRTWHELHISDESDVRHPRAASFVW